MALSASRLREDIYRILDRVAETGIPVEVKRRGKMLKIIAVEAPSKLANLEVRPEFLVGDPEEIVHLDWSSEWKGGLGE
ncbi:MAG: type II toxin-antitoxin system Phd/YefM family antitoxin [Acidobacteria bacterium]|nr:type II toxin-antitoxin system Phd/YefM family antitoxin [Acidobacteriota bacterium]